MKNKYNNPITGLIAIAFLVIVASSCSDFFVEPAGNQIRPEDHYNSITEFVEVSVPGVLAPLQSAMPNLVLIDGLLSDQMQITDNADGYMRDVNEHAYSFDNPYLDTKGFYQLIINVNEVLGNLYKITEKDPAFDEYYIKSFTNSLIGMRSWAYFTLAKLNGEVAWIEDNMSKLPSEGLNYIPKEAVLDTLVNQLLPWLHLDDNIAEILIPLYVNTKVLIGEIYLEKDDYENAAYYLKLGMESYGDSKDMLKVDKTFSKEVWYTIFVNAENNFLENIAVIPFSSSEGQDNPVTAWTMYNDQYVIQPSIPLMNLFESQIPVKGDQGDIYRGLGYTYDRMGDMAYIKKYSLDVAEPYSTDIIISRAADAHLLLAEALNRLGQHDYALYLLNEGFGSLKSKDTPDEYLRWSKNMGIRGRVNLEEEKVPSSLSSDAEITEYIEDLIIKERSLELAFEGKRYFDLMRIARRRNNPDFLASKVYEKFKDIDQGTGQAVKDLLKNPENWYVPLNK